MFEVLDTVAIKAFWLVGSFICFFLGGEKRDLFVLRVNNYCRSIFVFTRGVKVGENMTFVA